MSTQSSKQTVDGADRFEWTELDRRAVDTARIPLGAGQDP